MISCRRNRMVGCWEPELIEKDCPSRTPVTVVYSPGDGYPVGATFGVVQARVTLQMGGFEVGTVLECKGKHAMVERNNKLSKEIFDTKGWR